MSTIYVQADSWDALDPAERQAAIESVDVPVALGTPAEQYGEFTGDTFVPDATGTATRWYLWDDARLTEDHALALTAAVA